MILETPFFTVTRFTVLSLVLAFAIQPLTVVGSDFRNADAARSFQRWQAGDPPRGIVQSEDIETGDHVWDNVDVPYLIAEDLNIEKGASLTIRPGVTVELAPDAQIDVSGKLTAHGTKDRMITFTGQTKTHGSWLNVQIDGEEDDINDDCSFRYVTFEYGGKKLIPDARYGGTLSLNCARVTVDNCVIRESGTSGIYGSVLSSCEIRSTSFLNNVGCAVYLTVTSIFDRQAPDSLMRDLTASGNGVDGVGLAEAFPIAETVLEYTGLPYYVYGGLCPVEGASLQIEPGVTVKFDQGAGIGGTGPLTAIGTVDKPIVLTGITEEPGAWGGVAIAGILRFDWSNPFAMEWERNEGSRLSYVTIDYAGGSQGALILEYAKAYLSNCIIRNSERAGIYVDNADGSVIEWSRIEDNATFGVELSDGGAIQATHNWWGDASGPYHKKDNVTGTGNEIDVGAAEFLPFLISPDQEPGSIPADQVLSLTATPGRWFAPANGASLVPVSIVVRDANGDPVPGRKTRLNATIGDVVDGDISDFEGKAEASVSSTVVGNAMLTPALDLAGTYAARATTAEVTFTTPTTTLDLFPDAEAPYVNRHIGMSPLPITVGVPVTITAEVTNPSTYSLKLEISFVKHNYGVGLPLEVIETKTPVIAPQSATPVSATWTPLSPGHQCIGLMGSFSENQGLRGRFVEFPLADSTFELPWLHNTYPVPSPFLNQDAKNQLAQVETAVNALNDLSNAVQMIFDGAGFIGGFLTGFMLDNLLSALLDAWKDAIQAIQ
ncbi:MAG TPA: right-handed parallel beta-helix repeat-containing protein, partial [Sumerlaeia bacterium]|nr:right-handed parallel beta-helix repeat-containing protein [Sumerlaeia bacterium]